MYSLSKREIRQISECIRDTWPKSIKWTTKNLKAISTEKNGRLLVGDNFTLIQKEEQLIVPHLTELTLLGHFPNVIVDMGAVKFVCNGANVMRPGITYLDEFKQSDLVIVKDEKHRKSLAIGISLFDAESTRNFERGPVITNLHYVGDVFWELKKEIRN
jgi:malignant T-cell-amplified sequence